MKKLLSFIFIIALCAIFASPAVAQEDRGLKLGWFQRFFTAKTEVKAKNDRKINLPSENTLIIDNSDPIVCIQQVVEVRDRAIIVAQQKFSQALIQSINDRLMDQKNAWAEKDKKLRTTKIKETWHQFSEKQEELKNALRQDINSAWRIFYSTRKECGSYFATEDLTTQTVDNE